MRPNTEVHLTGRSYNLSQTLGYGNFGGDYYDWNSTYDGYELAVYGLENFSIVADKPGIEVKTYYGLAVDFARAEKAHFIVKGVRSAKDFEYEREQADINRMITKGEVETLLLYAEPHLSSISSSMVRELMHFGQDVSQFLP